MWTPGLVLELLHHAVKGVIMNNKRKFSSRSTATEAQICRLLDCLRLRPHHTHELRRLGISHPAGRIGDLLERGYTLTSSRITTVDSDGYMHVRAALYELLSEPDRVELERRAA